MTEQIILDAKENIVIFLTDEPSSARAVMASGEAVVGFTYPGDKKDWSSVPYLLEIPVAAEEEMCRISMRDAAEEDYLWLVYARMHGLPRIVAKTDRLIIREAVPTDAAALLSMYEDADAKRFLPGLHASIEEEAAAIEDYRKRIYEFYDYGTFTVVLKETGEVIGRVGLECYADYEGLELGYMIRADYRRKGYAEEACRALLSLWPEETIYARIAQENIPSRVLAEKLGIRVIETE